MSLRVEFPKGVIPIDYLADFAPAFATHENMQSALLGMRDSLRQAELLMAEPLGMFACITAEEEAAAFLYYALLTKGYNIKDHGKLHRHPDKVKVVIMALVFYEYFFKDLGEEFPRRIRIMSDNGVPKTCLMFEFQPQNGVPVTVCSEDPLETIVTTGEGEGAHDAAVDACVEGALSSFVDPSRTTASMIDMLAKRRNLSLYGNPANKPRLDPESFDHYLSNCVSITVLGLLVHNGRARTSSMDKLVAKIAEKIKAFLQKPESWD